jgi:hypothetical protein
MLRVYLHACQPNLPLPDCSAIVFCITSQQYVPCTTCQLCAEGQRVQHRSHMGQASKGVKASGRAPPLPFPGVDICLLCCLQVQFVCSASRRHAYYQPSRQLAESRPGTFMLQ